MMEAQSKLEMGEKLVSQGKTQMKEAHSKLVSEVTTIAGLLCQRVVSPDFLLFFHSL